MSTSRIARRYAAGLAGVAVVGIVGVTAAGPAAAATSSGGVQVVNTETVQVYASADGTPDTKRVYEQVAMTGKGSVDLANPVSTSGLRNLDGFSGFEVKDGKQLVKTTVDGEKKLRSVSDYKGSLPLDVSVSYELDGKKVSPGQVVGKKGHLKVTFVVENVTGKTQDVTVPDGKGGTVTKSVEVAIPMVGSLTTNAPENFTNVSSKQANMAGDGQGGTKLSFTMTLFPPIGSTTSTFGYEADVVDGVVPRVDISALPVNPLESPTFASAAKSYQGGADTGAKLTDGASQIDANLLKLRDGSADLLAGLIQLRDGAGQLSDGLNGEAAPGAKKLADGAGQLSDGLGKLDDGAGKLSAGVDTLDSKMPELADGAQQLDDGQAALVAGLKELRAGVAALPASVRSQLAGNADYQLLLGTLDKIVAGIGTPTDASRATLLGGLNLLKYGLRSPLGVGGCNQNAAPGAADSCGVGDGVEILQGKVAGGKTNIDTNLLPAAVGAYNGLVAAFGCPALSGGLPPLSALANPNALCRAGALSALGYGAPAQAGTPFPDGGLSAQLGTASSKLTAMKLGVDGGLVPGIDSVKKGLYNANCNPAQTDKTASDYCGVAQALGLIKAGIPTLVDKLSASIQQTLLDGIGQSGTVCKSGDDAQLLPCAEKIAGGQSDLNDGVKLLVAGVTKLQDGAGQLSDGATAAADGGSQVSDGATKLSDGLEAAGEGSDLLYGGLVKAAAGAPALPAGAQRLSDEGTKQLVAAGEDTAMSYGEMVAVMKAGAARADAEKMAYGAPSDAIGLTAYSYVLRGEDGEGGRNVARIAGGAVVLGAAGGLFFLRRRFLL